MSKRRFDPWRDFTVLSEAQDSYTKRLSELHRHKSLLQRNFRLHSMEAKESANRIIKRVIDVSASGVGLIMLAPLFGLTALAIKLEDPGPAFFTQIRIGLFGKPFTIYKFRSMVMNADKMKDQLLDQNESSAGVTFKMKNDPRITRTGKWIRKFSVDELPQLYNVLKGDMSLVGPRPPVPREVAEYGLADRRRLEVPPGITCIWQVSGRSTIPFPQQVELDRRYIHEQGFFKDIILLLKTIPAVISGRGAS